MTSLPKNNEEAVSKQIRMSPLSALKGFKDLLPEEARQIQWLEGKTHELFETFGFSPIRTPILEIASLFNRGIGEATDIIEKEMYTFEDWDGGKISLRPEGTASVVRAYIEHHLSYAPIAKFYYMGPMFRHERPQAGRLRQFHQIGAEIMGDPNPRQDVELLSLSYHFFRKLDVNDITLEINSLGCPQCRPVYRLALMNDLQAKISRLCEVCQRRYQSNPLRILDCKKPACKERTRTAPRSIDHLCPECQRHFKEVQEGLACLEIPHTLNPHLVRGLDYYTKTAFEITNNRLGSQNAVAAGGRYDGLVETLGGPSTPAVGFAIGIERLMQLIDPTQIPKPSLPLYIAPLGKAAGQFLLSLTFTLRKNGLACEMGNEAGNLKNQMKQADRLGAGHVLIVGESELAKRCAILRNMTTKMQEEIPFAKLSELLLSRLQH